MTWKKETDWAKVVVRGFMYLFFAALLATCVPTSSPDINRSDVTEITFNHGTMTVDAITYGDVTYNIYGMLLSDDIEHKYNVKLTCTEDVTVMTGRTRYRAPDATTGSYFCPKETSLEIKEVGGWITLAAKGTADKYVLRHYAPSRRDL